MTVVFQCLFSICYSGRDILIILFCINIFERNPCKGQNHWPALKHLMLCLYTGVHTCALKDSIWQVAKEFFFIVSTVCIHMYHGQYQTSNPASTERVLTSDLIKSDTYFKLLFLNIVTCGLFYLK